MLPLIALTLCHEEDSLKCSLDESPSVGIVET
jgi:hypothetical protein